MKRVVHPTFQLPPKMQGRDRSRTQRDTCESQSQGSSLLWRVPQATMHLLKLKVISSRESRTRLYERNQPLHMWKPSILRRNSTSKHCHNERSTYVWIPNRDPILQCSIGTFPPVCYYCGLGEETLVDNDEMKELRTSYAVVLPLCFICKSEGKSPICKRPSNVAKQRVTEQWSNSGWGEKQPSSET